MRTQTTLLALLPTLAVNAIRIIHANDDGWAELYTRSFFDELTAAGHDVVLSAPAENKSGTSSLDMEPSPRQNECQYDSCPVRGGPIGRNTTSPRLNWVNSFPVTSMRYGIDVIGPPFWNGEGPELAVSGPNVGSNLYLQVPFSGTVGSAVFAAKERGIPALAFSGGSHGTLPWNTSPVPERSRIYGQLATIVTNAIIASGKPYLPKDVWLNVNFPEVREGCSRVEDFDFVLSRINLGVFSAGDVHHCGSSRLPTEVEVVKSKKGCFVSISPGDAKDKTTVDAERQAVVLKKLAGLVSCMP